MDLVQTALLKDGAFLVKERIVGQMTFTAINAENADTSVALHELVYFVIKCFGCARSLEVNGYRNMKQIGIIGIASILDNGIGEFPLEIFGVVAFFPHIIRVVYRCLTKKHLGLAIQLDYHIFEIFMLEQ